MPYKFKIFIVLVCALAASGYAFWRLGGLDYLSPGRALALEVENCMAGNMPAHQAPCLDDYFEKRMTNTDVVQVLGEFADGLKISPRMREDCHQVAHAMGRAALARLGSIAEVFNLEREIETCGGGFFHGAIEKLFRAGTNDETGYEHITFEEMEEKIPSLCDRFTNKQRHSECVHGIGHGLFYMLGVLDQSKMNCRVFQNSSEQFSCLSGVFMEHSMSEDARNDFSENPQYPCSEMSGPERSACYYVLSFRLVNLGFSGGQIMEECAKVEGLSGELCSRGYGIFYLAHSALAGEDGQVRKFCSALPVKSARFCAESTAARMTAYSGSGRESFPFCAKFGADYLRASCFAYTTEVLYQREDMTGEAIAEECARYLKDPEECVTFISSEPVLDEKIPPII